MSQPPVFVISPNALMKKAARDALKPQLSTALMVALIAQLPMLIFNVAEMMLSTGMSNDLVRITNQLMSSETPDVWALIVEFLSVHRSTLTTLACIWVPAAIVTPVLALGQQHYLLELLRGKPGQITMVFSRLQWFFKALWQEIVIIVRTVLWSMLGGIPMLLGAVILILWPGEATLNIYWFLASSSSFVIIAISVWNMLKYAMAYCFLADDPTMRVRQSIRESVAMMRGRKGGLLSLHVSFIGWMLLQSLGVNAVAIMAGPVVGNTLSMLTSLVLSVYMQTAVTVFYKVNHDAKE